MHLLKAATENKLWILYSVNYVNGFGRYWSSTYIEKARSLFSHHTDVRAEGTDYHSGFAMQLVQDAK